MADDQGWAQTGYYGHPVLKTPHLDAMAAAGLRLDRFYAGAPVCSPTRAAVLTGRANDRTGVESHGYGLRRQEITIAQLLGEAGYATGHFGKWHLDALRGPGVPILLSDDHHPGEFGFDHWLSVTNYFDRDPILSRRGKLEEFAGDSSEIVVSQALKFMRQQVDARQPFFTVIWYGTPHSPFKASKEDQRAFAELDEQSRHHYGELVAMDRSIGALRTGLRELKAADNTLVWFCSDNGGLPKIQPSTVGPLRGNKGTIYEGGLRVPGIIEWPAGIPSPRITKYPASVLDILPTLLEITEVSYPDQRPLDGVSLKPLFQQELPRREKPIPFRHIGKAALIDNDFKLLTAKIGTGKFQLYNLADDPGETTDLSRQHPEIAKQLRARLTKWSRSVDASFAGKDYPEGRVDPNEPKPRFWTEVEQYKPFFSQWQERWEYQSRLKPNTKKRRN
ncbi:MAG: sulfatase-like hydrolase/transferase [Pirellulales bacterium]|nr:sulfatase-like hydrolase/transferase [Pirellulales bacterium]